MDWPKLDDSHLRFKHDRPSKFCVVTAYRGGPLWNRLGNITTATKVDYCARHGYGFRDYKLGWMETRPVSWSKLLFVQDALRTYEWVFWIDADAAVTNSDVKLSSLIKGGEELVVCETQNMHEKEMHLRHLNLGVFLAKAGKFTSDWMETVWAKEHLVNHPWWEQQAFIEAFNEREDIRSLTRVAQGREFNSMCPWRFRLDQEYKWSHGDFVLHISAFPMDVRIMRMTRLLSWAKSGDPFYETTAQLYKRAIAGLFQRGAGVVCGVDEGLLPVLAEGWKGRVYLIDTWKHLPGYRDIRNLLDGELEKRYQMVQGAWGTNSGMKVVRNDPSVVAENFADEGVDWVYIDGPHRADIVEKNLKAWWPKVRVGGLLCGHDFVQDPNHPSACFEVVSTVVRFAASQFARHRFSESLVTPCWSIKKTGIPVSDPTVLDWKGFPALFRYWRYKIGVVIDDSTGEFVDQLGDSKAGQFVVASEDAIRSVREFDRHSLDWVFLGSENDVRNRIGLWWDKVRPGGTFCGIIPEEREKIASVDEFLAERGLIVTETTAGDKRGWFVRK